MKKTIIALTLAGMTTSAYASKARVQALGQGSDDNYFIKDSRSIWYNVSHIHDYKDTMWMEFGNSAGQATALGTDQEAAPKAQGGFLKSSGNWTYGAHLGEESNTGVLLRLTAESADGATATTLLHPDNVLDVFVGQDMGGMKWGANLMYSKTKFEDSATATNNLEQSAMAVRVGASSDMWEAHINASLKGESKSKATTPEEFDGGLGLHAGGSYNLGSGKVIANYKTFKWDIKNATHTTAVEAKYNQMWLGYGHENEVAGGTLFTQVYYVNTKIEAAFTAGDGAADLKHTEIPLVIGFEAKATDWLTWRGSVSANLMGTVEHKGISSNNFNDNVDGLLAQNFGSTPNTAGSTATTKGTLANSATVSGGATLNFGKLSVDGLIGTTGSARNGTVSNRNGLLATDNLLTRVGMSYAF